MQLGQKMQPGMRPQDLQLKMMDLTAGQDQMFQSSVEKEAMEIRRITELQLGELEALQKKRH